MGDHRSKPHSAAYPGIEKVIKKEVFETIASAMYEGLMILDEEGTIIYINPSYTRINGVKPEKLLGKKLRDIDSSLETESITH